MKLEIDVVEFKALVAMLAPQVVYVEGGPAVGQITSAPGYEPPGKVTTEEDYFTSLARITAPGNGKNGKDHGLAAQIAAAQELLPTNSGS